MLSRRNLLLSGLTTGLLIPSLSGCAPQRPLKVGLNAWIGNQMLPVAQSLGFFDERVQIIANRSATESIQALQNGSLDAATLTLDEVLLARDGGVNLTIVMIFDISAGGDKLIARPDIATLADLKGKRIAYEASALGALMLHKILETAQLTHDDVIAVNIPVGALQLTSWRKHQVDAVISYDPPAAQIVAENGRILIDSRRFPETIFDVLAVRSDRIEPFEDAILHLLKGHQKALHHLKINIGDTVHRIASSQGASAEHVKTALRGLRLPDAHLSCRLLAPQGRLEEAAAEIGRIMFENGLLEQTVNLHHLTTTDFCRKLTL